MCTNITKELGTQEELCPAERVFRDENKRLQDAIKAQDMGEMTVVQRLLDVAYPNMEAFKKKRGFDTQSRKVTHKIVASVFTKNK